MSEYQYYEFLAVDRPLSAEQQEEVRATSTRARITATSFTNEYHWGDYHGSPQAMVARFYDLHLYYANWGTGRLMVKIPTAALEGVDLERYVVGEHMTVRGSGAHVVLDLGSEPDPEDDGYWEEDDAWTLGELAGIRSEILDGDLRGLYLVFLAAIGVWAYDEEAFDYADGDVLEPPVPAGLGELTAAQQALARFLRLDPELLAEAATQSRPRSGARTSDLAAWVAALPPALKDETLVDLLAGGGSARGRLLRRFRSGDAPGTRTIGELLDEAALRRDSSSSASPRSLHVKDCAYL